MYGRFFRFRRRLLGTTCTYQLPMRHMRYHYSPSPILISLTIVWTPGSFWVAMIEIASMVMSRNSQFQTFQTIPQLPRTTTSMLLVLATNGCLMVVVHLVHLSVLVTMPVYDLGTASLTLTHYVLISTTLMIVMTVSSLPTSWTVFVSARPTQSTVLKKTHVYA